MQARWLFALGGPLGLAFRCRMLAVAVSSILASWVGPAAHHGFAERCVSPPLSRRLLGPPHRGMARVAAVETTSRTAIRPDPPTSSTNSHRQPASSLADAPPDLGGLSRRHSKADQPAPSGLRAGTPDRRGKRGEVAAIFVMITTEPTWSIGELGLGITSRTSAPNIPQALTSCRISSSLGSPRGTSSTPPSRSSGIPNSATTGSGPSARAVATSKRSRSAPRPNSSRRACATRTLSIPSLLAMASTQPIRLRWASTSVKRVAGCAAARGNPGSPAPEPRSTHSSSGSGVRIVANPRASSRCRSRKRSPSRGPRNPRSTAWRYARSSSPSKVSVLSSRIPDPQTSPGNASPIPRNQTLL
jgi:hypothetical protein